MSASKECCGWKAWAEMAGMDADGRPLAGRAQPGKEGNPTGCVAVAWRDRQGWRASSLLARAAMILGMHHSR